VVAAELFSGHPDSDGAEKRPGNCESDSGMQNKRNVPCSHEEVQRQAQKRPFYEKNYFLRDWFIGAINSS